MFNEKLEVMRIEIEPINENEGTKYHVACYKVTFQKSEENEYLVYAKSTEDVINFIAEYLGIYIESIVFKPLQQ